MRHLSRPVRAVVALVVLVAAVVATVVAVRAANGDYSGSYRLTGYFPHAGEGLEPGSEVVYRGVQVGRVSTISLRHTDAKVTLLIQPDFRVPADASAVIEPVNLFGAEQVTLVVPGRGRSSGGVTVVPGQGGTGITTVTGTDLTGTAPNATGPTTAAATSATPGTGRYLAPGSTISHTATGDELGTLFAAAAPLLRKITKQNLATVIGELAQASNGEGPRIKASLNAGASLASYFDRTLAAQLAALDSFSRFTATFAPEGTTINGLSKEENIALPAFNQDAADWAKLLANLTAFSAELAKLLTDYHPTIVTLLDEGDNPARVLTAQQTELGQVIHGAFKYAFKVGTAKSGEALPTGSHFVYFTTFITFGTINTLVCHLLAPAQTNMAFLEPLQQALAGSGTAFTCKSEFAAFDAMQTTSNAPLTLNAPSAAPVSGSTATKALGALGGQTYGKLGQPSNPRSTSLGGYVGSLLGGT